MEIEILDITDCQKKARKTSSARGTKKRKSRKIPEILEGYPLMEPVLSKFLELSGILKCLKASFSEEERYILISIAVNLMLTDNPTIVSTDDFLSLGPKGYKYDLTKKEIRKVLNRVQKTQIRKFLEEWYKNVNPGSSYLFQIESTKVKKTMDFRDKLYPDEFIDPDYVPDYNIYSSKSLNPNEPLDLVYLIDKNTYFPLWFRTLDQESGENFASKDTLESVLNEIDRRNIEKPTVVQGFDFFRNNSPHEVSMNIDVFVNRSLKFILYKKYNKAEDSNNFNERYDLLVKNLNSFTINTSPYSDMETYYDTVYYSTSKKYRQPIYSCLFLSPEHLKKFADLTILNAKFIIDVLNNMNYTLEQGVYLLNNNVFFESFIEFDESDDDYKRWKCNLKSMEYFIKTRCCFYSLANHNRAENKIGELYNHILDLHYSYVGIKNKDDLEYLNFEKYDMTNNCVFVRFLRDIIYAKFQEFCKAKKVYRGIKKTIKSEPYYAIRQLKEFKLYSKGKKKYTTKMPLVVKQLIDALQIDYDIVKNVAVQNG